MRSKQQKEKRSKDDVKTIPLLLLPVALSLSPDAAKELPDFLPLHTVCRVCVNAAFLLLGALFMSLVSLWRIESRTDFHS